MTQPLSVDKTNEIQEIDAVIIDDGANTTDNDQFHFSARDVIFLELTGTSGNDTITGTSAAEEIIGGNGSDNITGGDGNDTIYGGDGIVDADDAADTIAGGKGADYIISNGGNDVIYGGGAAADPGDGNDTIFAGVGDDVVYGNGGNDVIYGLSGNDQLHGGIGDDTYVFLGSDGIDVINFFEGAGSAGGDIIQIRSDINGSGFTTAQQVVDSITYSGNGSAVILLGGSNILTIESPGTLSADDFQII